MKPCLLLCAALLFLLAGSFQSQAAAPIAVTVGVSDVSSNAATLHGTVTPRAANTRAYFQWGLTTNYGNVTSTQVLSGSVALPVQQPIAGLGPRTTYHFRTVARNAYGVRYGTNISFVTAGLPPTVTTENATGITTNSATLNGTVNPNGLATSIYFEWGTTTSYGMRTATQQVGAGSADISVQASLSNLVPGASYHYRLVASNAAGTTYGDSGPFVTLSTPAVTTGPATVVSNTATLNGAVNPNGAMANVRFEWGTTIAYGNSTPVQIVPAGTTSVPVTGTIGPLAPNVYHFRIMATSAGGSGVGADQSFVVQSDGEIVLNHCAEADLRTAFLTHRTVRFTSDCVITLTSPLIVTSEKVLDATGHSVVLSGGNSSRLFEVQANASLSLIHLTIANGMKRGSNGIISATAPEYNGESVFGGALAIASASFSAIRCVFSNSAAVGGNGSNNPVQVPGGLGGSASGGAIYGNSSSLILSNCTFQGNYAAGGISGPDPSNPSYPPLPANSFGGAIFVKGGELLLANCSFTNNSAAVRGGGGAVWCQATNLQVMDSRFTMNTAQMGGAVLDQSARSSIASCFFFSNAAVGAPYIRWNASLAPAYGGAYHHTDGAAILDRCVFTLNTAIGAVAGQGAFNTWWASSGFGGALAHVGGSLALTRSLLVSNWTKAGPISPPAFGFIPSYPDGLGGAVYLSAGSAITNCTFSTNRAIGEQQFSRGGRTAGGAISVEGGTAAVHFCTLAGNNVETSATNPPPTGGGIAASGGILQMANSILSQNRANGGFENFYSSFTDLGHNISSDATPPWTSGTSLNNTDPLLLPLANNGGPTLTMALGAGSPALDSADCATAPATDQRGAPRPSGAGCDIGAYEGSAPLPPYIHIFRESSSTNVLRWLGEAGRAYRIEGSADLSGWTFVARNVANSNGWLDYRVPANPSPRFFRLLAQ